MTAIEDLVRQALAETPAPTTSTDPLAALDRRVRRARRRLAAGAGVVAAVVAAAVVVPLAVLGGGSPNSVKSITPPKQTQLPAGTTLLWPSEAVSSATDSSGRVWVLYKQEGHVYLQPVDDIDKLTSVEGSADYLLENGDTLWVLGTSSAADGTRTSVTAIDTHTGNRAPGEMPQATDAAVIQDSLYVIEDEGLGPEVSRFDFNDNGMGQGYTARIPNAQQIVATAQGRHLWVHAGNQLIELTPTAHGLTVGSGGFTVGTRVNWGSGSIYAPTLPRSAADGVWAYDGSRLIALMPSNLAGCVSCAEGARVAVAGAPSAVVETHDGLFVAIPGSGVDFYTPDAMNAGTAVSQSLAGVQAVSMVEDPDGGVDVTDSQGRLFRWDPAGAGSR